MSMILLKPANKIIHLNVGIKRRTISLTGFSETTAVGSAPPNRKADNYVSFFHPAVQACLRHG